VQVYQIIVIVLSEEFTELSRPSRRTAKLSCQLVHDGQTFLPFAHLAGANAAPCESFLFALARGDILHLGQSRAARFQMRYVTT